MRPCLAGNPQDFYVWLQDALSQREDRGVGSPARADLGVDVADMTLHGPDAEDQVFGDLAVGLATGHQPQDLGLPAGQPGGGSFFRGWSFARVCFRPRRGPRRFGT